MTLRDAICAEALTWRDTPYHDHAALKGIGCDCVGLLIGVAKAVQILSDAWQPGYYSPQWQLHKNEEQLLQVLTDLGCVQIPLEERVAGTILVFQYGRVCSHTAILVSTAPDYVLHAQRDLGRVVHQRLAGDLLERLRQAYRFPGIV